MGHRQDWELLNATQRAERVSELYFRGLTPQAIARQLGATQGEIAHFIRFIQASAYKSEMMDEFFENLQQRTMEHLAALDSQIEIAYQELDSARERVVVVTEYGAPIKEIDPETGEPSGKFLLAPRHSASIPKLMKQIEVLLKQKAEVLKIVGQKADVTVKLQVTHQVQTVIMEFIQTLSPDIYAELYRQIQAIVPDSQMLDKTIEGTYTEALPG